MLGKRVLTALILAPVVIACVFFLPAFQFSLFIAFVLAFAGWEWANLAGFSGVQRYVYALVLLAVLGLSTWVPAIAILLAGMLWWLVAFVLVLRFPELTRWWASRWPTAALGLLTMVPAFVGLTQLKLQPDSSFLIMLLFILIWGADIGAYFSGKALGRAKLAPRVSPGKSWAGFYGGLLTALVLTAGAILWHGSPVLWTQSGMVFFIGCALVVVVSVLGDLVESMFKRERGIKDSSNLLPGHGGVLDRIDSLLAASPLFALLVLVLA
jgi:phosphatidate cytidylyltransferase